MPLIQSHCPDANEKENWLSCPTAGNPYHPTTPCSPKAASPKKFQRVDSSPSKSFAIQTAVGPKKNHDVEEKGHLCHQSSFPLHSPAVHSGRCRSVKLFIGPEGIHNMQSYLEIHRNPRNGLMDIFVRGCPVIIEKDGSGEASAGRLIIRTLRAAEQRHHEAYKQYVTKNIDPYHENVKPYTRDFCLYIMKIVDGDFRQARFEVAKYKRRSMYAKYRILAQGQKSKKKRFALVSSIFNSISFAESVDQGGRCVQKKLKRDALNNITVQECTSLDIVLDNGHTLRVERSSQKGQIMCTNLPRHVSERKEHVNEQSAHQKFHNLFAVTSQPCAAGETCQDTIVIERMDRVVNLQERQWSKSFMEYLHHCVASDNDSETIKVDSPNGHQENRLASNKFNLNALYRHLHSFSLEEDDLRSETRRFLRTSLLQSYDKFLSTWRHVKNQTKLHVMEMIITDLMEIEQDEENEERAEGKLILSSYLMDKIQTANTLGKPLWMV